MLRAIKRPSFRKCGSSPSDGEGEADRYFEHYWEYARLWRTWVVGIAVGALFILLNKDVGSHFTCRAFVATLFIAAAGAQVLVAWVNKVSSYYRWREEDGDQGRWTLRLSAVTGWYCIDVICDLWSLGCVVVAVAVMVAEMVWPDLGSHLPFLASRPAP